MNPLIALALVAPIVVTLGAWHFAGYFNGRYERWSREAS